MRASKRNNPSASSPKLALSALLSADDFKGSPERVAYLQGLLRDSTFQDVLAVLRNFSLVNIACVGAPTGESAAYDLGRAHGRAELFSILLSLARHAEDRLEPEQDYNVTNEPPDLPTPHNI